MSTTVADAHDAHDEHHGPEKGIKRWLFTTNHKDIGTMYLIFSLVMFFIGGAMAMVIRGEQPAADTLGRAVIFVFVVQGVCYGTRHRENSV